MRFIGFAVVMAFAFGIRDAQAQAPGNPGSSVDATVTGSAAEGLPGSASGQAFAGPVLPPGHWAVEALERAAALLLLSDWLPGQRAVPLEMVDAGFGQAMREAGARDPEMLPVVEQWHARLLREFPGLTNASGGGWRAIQRAAGIGFELREGAAAPGLGEFEPHRTGALDLPDRQVPVASVDLAASWTRHLSIAGAFEADPDEARVVRLELAVGAGRWRGSIGRGEVGYGFGIGGGAALTGNAPIDAVQLGTREALELPGVLGALGRASLHTFLGHLEEDRHPDGPYFWGASVQVKPNRRFTLGVNRAAMFGGDEAITPGRVASMLIGRVKGIGFENQIVTVSGRLVLPTERLVPSTLHLEWGAEDAAGSWWSVPGIVGGLTIPSVPGLPGLALAGEYAHFGSSCCGNPSWYRHWSFHGGWASGDRTLGHPLGGNGSEVNIAGTLDLRRGRVKGQVFRRDRGAENLYAPEREGVSRGIASRIEWNLGETWQLRLEAGHEAGGSWSESRVRIGMEHF